MSTIGNKGSKKSRATHALIFELEFVATNGREVMFEVLQKVMKTKNIELTPIKYSRSGMSPLSRASIKAIMADEGKKSDAIEKAVAEVDSTIKGFCATMAELDKGLAKLIAATQEKGIPVLAFSAWPEEIAVLLMRQLGLTDMGVSLIIPDEVKESFPRADSWLKMLKKCDKEDATLVAIVSSQTACKGALTAGAACIAVPDQFTVYQDFSGAKMVLDSLSDVKPSEILDLTLRM